MMEIDKAGVDVVMVDVVEVVVVVVVGMEEDY